MARAWAQRLKQVGYAALPSVLSVLLSLALCFLAIALTRNGPGVAWRAYLQMLWGGAGDLPAFLDGGNFAVLSRPWGEAALKASLLTLTGLSVAVAFSVGLFNIGGQGQLTVGALTAAVLGAQLALPRGLHPMLCLVAAMAAGALYGLIPAWLRVRRGVHEVISTIMLNWIAIHLTENWLVVGPLRALSSGDQSRSGTQEVLASAHLPRLLGDSSRLNAGFLVALLLTWAVWLWLRKTWHGFQTRTVGLSPEAARTAGIPVSRRMYQAMAISGALSGLAGAVLILGTEYKYPATLSAPYGFDGIAIAMIGQSHPLGVLAAAALFGTLRAGGTRMQLLGVHKSFPELIQGLALLLVAGRLAWVSLLNVRRRKRPAPEAPRA